MVQCLYIGGARNWSPSHHGTQVTIKASKSDGAPSHCRTLAFSSIAPRDNRACSSLVTLTLSADLTYVSGRREQKSDSGPALAAAIDMELATEIVYAFANVKKTNRLGVSSLVIKRVKIEAGTIIGNDNADLVWPPMLHRDMHCAAASVLKRI